jgi:protein TonB
MALPLLMLARGTGLAMQPAEMRFAYGQGGQRHRLLSGAMAMALTGGVFALLTAGLVIPQMVEIFDPPLVTREIPLPRPVDPPEAIPENEQPRQPETHITTVRRDSQIPTVVQGPLVAPFDGPVLPPIPDPGFDPGPLVRPADPPAHVPVLNGVARDARFAGRFQPEYPTAMIRAEREGVCRVSVTVAPSGRVSAVRQLSCDDPAFFRATERQALSQWRFRPATRDGAAVEGTIEQTVRFQLPD